MICDKSHFVTRKGQGRSSGGLPSDDYLWYGKCLVFYLTIFGHVVRMQKNEPKAFAFVSVTHQRWPRLLFLLL